jgi:DNA modification methylase/ParB-like chromosome segregation protein Spo0J
MHIARTEDIIIKPNRQRQEFDPAKHQELITSIAEIGLMHAPVIRFVDGKPELVAGERRFRAMREMHELGIEFSYDGVRVSTGFIPCVKLSELSLLAAEEAELDENLKRVDLTWQEHAAAVTRLHLLRQAQAAQKGKAHSVADTAKELNPEIAELPAGKMGSHQAELRQELIVARNLDNPAIAKAKDVKEAFKILKAIEQTEKNEELARTVGLTFSAESHKLYNMSCLEYMQQAPEAESAFDVICTDPPYGMGADEFGDAGGKMTGITHKYRDDYESWQPLMKEFSRLSYHITKDQAHAYLFCDFDRFHELKGYMEAAGWYVFRTPLVIHKLGSGRVPLPDRGPRRQWELVLYAIKGKKPTTHIYPDVISAAADDSTGHGAQKPVAVIHNLLQRSVRPGDRVFDGFAGSGSVFPAAHSLQCEVVACELDAGSYGIALRRLQAMAQPDPLTALEQA